LFHKASLVSVVGCELFTIVSYLNK